MTVLQAAALGLLQGLAEFLPISSSGHLALARACLPGMPAPNLAFDVFLHACTSCSVVVVFRNDVALLLRGVASFVAPKRLPSAGAERGRVLLLALSAVPAGVVGLALESRIEEIESRPKIVAALLFATGLWLAICSLAARRRTARAPNEASREIGVVEALVMGLAQAVAILPGISRSGATIGAGILVKADRASVGSFAFLMSLPPILGASLLKLLKLLDGADDGPRTPIVALIAGGATAFFAGYVALRFLLTFIRRGRLEWFAAYCVVASVAATLRLGHGG
jgi:undecaprenyl-diphosphatase